MYIKHFGFTVNPFSLTASPEFCYESSTFKTVYDELVEHIQNKHEIVLLTGETGVGKTYLLSEFEKRSGPRFHCVYPQVATDNFEDIVDSLCDELKFEAPDKSFLVKMKLLNEFLSANKHHNIHTVLIVDDAHNLHEESLKALSLIATPASEHNGSLQVLFSGLPELEEKLHLAIPGQITDAHCKIDRLNASEVDGFIKRRLDIANYPGDGLFTSDAISRVAAYSNGIPRVIVKLCGSALLATSLEKKQTVSAEIVSKSAQYSLPQADEKVINARSSDSPKEKPNKMESRPRRRPGIAPPVVWAMGLVSVMVAGGLVYQMSGLKSGVNPPQLNLAMPETQQTPETEHPKVQSSPVAADSAPANEIPDPVAEVAALSDANPGQSAPTGDSRQTVAVAFPPPAPSKPPPGLEPARSVPEPAVAAQPGDNARQLIGALEDPAQARDLDTLYREADRLDQQGQSTDAYLLYFYAAKRGHGEAAFELARLADPATFEAGSGMLDTPNLAQANKWYQHALAAGHGQARQALSRLHAQVARQAARGDEPARRLMLQLDETPNAQP